MIILRIIIIFNVKIRHEAFFNRFRCQSRSCLPVINIISKIGRSMVYKILLTFFCLFLPFVCNECMCIIFFVCVCRIYCGVAEIGICALVSSFVTPVTATCDASILWIIFTCAVILSLRVNSLKQYGQG